MALLELESFDGLTEEAFFSKWDKQDKENSVSFTTGRTGDCLVLVGPEAISTTINLPLNIPIARTVTIGMALKTIGTGSVPSHNEFGIQGETGYHFKMQKANRIPNRRFFVNNTTVIQDIVYSTAFYRYLEIQLYANASGTCKVKLDGVTILDYNGDTFQNGIISAFEIGLQSISNPSTKHIDDFYILDDTGSDNNDFLGPIQIEAIYPNANGNTNDFTGSDADSTNNYLLVDESAIDKDDYVEDSTIGNKDLYGYSAITIADIQSIVGLKVESFVRLSESGIKGFKNIARSNTTEEDSSEMFSVSEDNVIYDSIYEQDPDASSAWTETTVNAAQFGIKVTS